MALNVFVSYSTKDLPDLDELRSRLTLPGINLFVSEHCESFGKPLNDSIAQALRNCDLFVLLWSKNADESGYVHQEIGFAKSLGKKIFPIMLEPDLQLPGMIQELRYISAFENKPDVLTTIQRQVLQDASSKNVQGVVFLVLLAIVFLWIARSGK